MTDIQVNKLTIQWAEHDYATAAQQQALAKHWAQHTLPIILEKALDSLPSTEFYFIDKLEIELGTKPWQTADNEWIELIAKQVKLWQPMPQSKIYALVWRHWFSFLRKGYFDTNAPFQRLVDFERFLINYWADYRNNSISEVAPEPLSPFILQQLLKVHHVNFIGKFLHFIYHTSTLKPTTEFASLLINFSEQSVDNHKLIFDFLINTSTENLDKVINQPKLNSKQLNKLILTKTTAPTPQSIENSTVNDTIETPTNTKILVKNAGLILIQRYLPTFFDNLGLLSSDKSSFINDQSQLWAMQAVHFLATGSHFAQADELLLAKLLCGVEASTPIKFSKKLPRFMVAECNDLLKSVIDNWSVLRNSSPEALREGFLQRSGLLQQAGSHIELWIDESGVDILLSKLPWSFGFCKFSFNTITITTYWY